MRTCSAFIVSLELQASSCFRLDDVCVHEACNVENATVVEMKESIEIARSDFQMLQATCCLCLEVPAKYYYVELFDMNSFMIALQASIKFNSLFCRSLSSKRLMKTFSWCL